MTPSRTSTPRAAAPQGGADGRLGAALWGLLFVLAGNMLIDALEVSVSLVALPSIGDDLGLAAPRLQWVVTGFAAGFGGLLLFGGRLVSLLGRRPVYLAALAVFALASLAGALAQDPYLLFASRFVKGFCAALTAPTGLAIIAAVFPEGPARGRAVAVYSLFGAGGFSAGLLLSGALTGVSWRWAFAFPAPVALLLLLAGLRLIPRDRPAGPGADEPGADGPGAAKPAGYRVTSALTLTGTVLALVHAIASAAGTGRSAPHTIGALVVAALLGTLFVRAELRAPHPLVRLDLLAREPLVRSALGAGALNGSYLGLLLISTLHLQQRAGWSPWETGLAFLPASAPLALTAMYSGRIATRFGPARLIAAGAAAAPLGYALYPRDSGADVHYATDVLPTMLLVGAAFVLAFTSFHLQATSSVPVEAQAAAGGLYQTAVQLGAALVTAGAAALYPAGYTPALLLVTAVGLAGFLLALRGLRPRRAAPGAAH